MEEELLVLGLQGGGVKSMVVKMVAPPLGGPHVRVEKRGGRSTGKGEGGVHGGEEGM